MWLFTQLNTTLQNKPVNLHNATSNSFLSHVYVYLRRNYHNNALAVSSYEYTLSVVVANYTAHARCLFGGGPKPVRVWLLQSSIRGIYEQTAIRSHKRIGCDCPSIAGGAGGIPQQSTGRYCMDLSLSPTLHKQQWNIHAGPYTLRLSMVLATIYGVSWTWWPIPWIWI